MLLPQGEGDLTSFKAQAKHLFKRLNDQSPPRCTLETKDNIVFQCVSPPRGPLVPARVG